MYVCIITRTVVSSERRRYMEYPTYRETYLRETVHLWKREQTLS